MPSTFVLRKGLGADAPRIGSDGTMIVRVATIAEGDWTQMPSNTGATHSVSDYIDLAGMKIPVGAVVTKLEVIGATKDGTTTFKVGTSRNDAQFGSLTLVPTTAVTNLVSAVNYTASFSDDCATARWEYIRVTVNAKGTSTSTSASLCLVLHYVPKHAI